MLPRPHPWRLESPLMHRVAYTLPIKPGKDKDLRDAMAKIGSDHSEEHARRREEQGIRRIIVWEQMTPAPAFILYMETEEHPGGHFEKMHAGKDDFQELLARTITEVSGVDFREFTKSGPPVEVIMDWHVEHGHSLAGHRH